MVVDTVLPLQQVALHRASGSSQPAGTSLQADPVRAIGSSKPEVENTLDRKAMTTRRAD